jgi:hypothetical protein
MATPQRPKRMFKGQERASRYEVDRQPKARMQQMADQHQDVLQNIEFVFVDGHREDATIDDRHVDAALKAALGDAEPEDPRAIDLFEELKIIRQIRQDVPEPIWLECLRVVQQSVKRHSNLRPGEKTYLSFAARFIP